MVAVVVQEILVKNLRLPSSSFLVCLLAFLEIPLSASAQTPAPNQWTWMGGSGTVLSYAPVWGTEGTAAASNYPGPTVGASTWTDSSGNFWLWGSQTLWKFSPSTNEWTWISGGPTTVVPGMRGVYGTKGTPAPGNVPGERSDAASWIDSAGNLWLFGGEGWDVTGQNYGDMNDLWEFNPSTSEWTWVSGSEQMSCVSGGLVCGSTAVYGSLGTPAPANVPGGRNSAASWIDSHGHLWLFGGIGYDSNFGTPSSGGALNDVWEFDPTTSEWTWMGGPNAVNQYHSGVYGTLDVPAPGNIPGPDNAAITWTDKSGDFWLFGGGLLLNELWEFYPSTNEWAWMGGTAQATCGSPCNSANPVYGTLGVPAAGNVPGPRWSSASWTDSSGNLWLFGGFGTGAAESFGYLNDLWEYYPATNEWAWMGGSATIPNDGIGQGGILGTYGVLGAPAPGNVPGSRDASAGWTDKEGNFWLLGGTGYGGTVSESVVTLDDFWEYHPSASPLPVTATPTFSVASGSYTSVQTETISDATNGATIYYTTDGTTPTTASPVYAGQFLVESTETVQAFAMASGCYTSNQATAAYTVTLPLSATVFVTPFTSPVQQSQAISEVITVNGIAGHPTPTGSVTLSSATYTSAATALVSGSATINIPAGALAAGTDVLSAAYSGDAAYASAVGSTTITITGFNISGTAVTVEPGATTGNTSTITLTPVGGYTGSIALTAAITSSPAGAVALPTLSFGATTPASIAAATSATATLTIATTLGQAEGCTSQNRVPRRTPWFEGGGAILACVILFGIPVRRRSWRAMLGLSILLAVVAGSVASCGGSGVTKACNTVVSAGTTPGAYIITVTGTSGTTTSTGTVTLNVQ